MNSTWITGLVILGALVWVIGAGTTLNDLLENGMTLKDYRKKYGHDLGLMICCWSRSLSIVGWPAMGGVRFAVGVIRDSIKLVFGKKTVADEIEYGDE